MARTDVGVLNVQEFYTRVAGYMHRVDPTWEEERWQAQQVAERATLGATLGEAADRAVLDCSCGTGGQAVPLAKLGWRVTGADITAASLATARSRASREGVAIDLCVCDMRDLGRRFGATFDCVVSCMALDNITVDAEIGQAVSGMFAALKPGGTCYLRLRDFDHLMSAKPRYEWKEERGVPYGRVIRLEDWEYESGSQVLCSIVFLREDTRKEGYRWTTDVFSYRRRALRKVELERFLMVAGFGQIAFLPQPSPWHPYEVVASKALSCCVLPDA